MPSGRGVKLLNKCTLCLINVPYVLQGRPLWLHAKLLTDAKYPDLVIGLKSPWFHFNSCLANTCTESRGCKCHHKYWPFYLVSLVKEHKTQGGFPIEGECSVNWIFTLIKCELDFYIDKMTSKQYYVSRLKTPLVCSLAGSSIACQPRQTNLMQLCVEH